MADPKHDQIAELKRRLRRERVERARARHPIDKIFDGVELRRIGRWAMSLGVRMQHPEADDAEVERLVRKRLSRRRERDEIR